MKTNRSSQIDKSGCCYQCSWQGHTARECNFPANCPVCVAADKLAQHRIEVGAGCLAGDKKKRDKAVRNGRPKAEPPAAPPPPPPTNVVQLSMLDAGGGVPAPQTPPLRQPGMSAAKNEHGGYRNILKRRHPHRNVPGRGR